MAECGPNCPHGITLHYRPDRQRGNVLNNQCQGELVLRRFDVPDRQAPPTAHLTFMRLEWLAGGLMYDHGAMHHAS